MLTDGTTFSARVLQKDGESLYLAVPRSAIATVNGQPLPPPIAAGFAAPAFSATDLAGGSQNLAAKRGRPLLLQFWASWCPHCRSDVSYMKELAARSKEGGVQLVTVSVDQSLDELTAFVAKEQLPYSEISSVTHPDVAEAYEVQGIPAYRLVDAQGQIVQTWSGSLTEGDAHGKAELDALLKQPD